MRKSPEPSVLNGISLAVRRALDGDSESLYSIIEEFHPFLLCHARYRLKRHLGFQYSAEDLANQVWAKFLERLRAKRIDLQPRNNRYTPVLLKYLSTILHNTYRDWLKSSRRRGLLSMTPSSTLENTHSQPQMVVEASSITSRIARSERSAALHQAIAHLSPELSELVVLRGIEQLSYREIAAKLTVSEATAASHYSRALMELQFYLSPTLAAEFRDT